MASFELNMSLKALCTVTPGKLGLQRKNFEGAQFSPQQGWAVGWPKSA